MSATDSAVTPVHEDCSSRADRVLRLLAVSELALLFSTWPLWWGAQAFPAIPLLPLPCSFTAFNLLSRVLTAVFLGILVILALRPQHRGFSAAALACAAGLVLLNQHRLQPWHWLLMLVVFQRLLLPGSRRVETLWLTFGTIYVFSALSRITMETGSTMTEAILRQLAAFLPGLTVGPLSAAGLTFLDAAVIASELAVGLALVVPRTRTAGVIGCVIMHVLLLLALGPAGLDHHPGVLIWNLSLAVMIPALAVGDRRPDTVRPAEGTNRIRAVQLLIVAYPLSGLFAIADNWPSWQLYSPRPESVRLLIDGQQLDKLPAGARDHAAGPILMTDWYSIRLDRWSLADVKAPIYPEDRFLLAVCAVLVESIPDGAFQVEINEPDVPLWWRRSQATFVSHAQLQERLRSFLLPPQVIRPSK